MIPKDDIKLPGFGFELFDTNDKFETTRGITPKSMRARAKTKLVNGMKKQSLEELMPDLPEDGEYIHIISNGNYDYYGFVPLFAERIGVIDEFWGSTWTINRANVENLVALYDAGKIKDIHIITGLYFKHRETSVYATLVQEMAKRGQKYISCNTHAKVMLFRAGDRYFVVEGSANFTANPRIEQNIVCQSKPLWEHHRGWMGEYFSVGT